MRSRRSAPLDCRLRWPLFVLLVSGLMCTSVPAAFAQSDDAEALQEEINNEEVAGQVLAGEEDDDTREDGWYYGLVIGGSGAISHSENVVGAVDGLTLAVGLLLYGDLTFVEGKHEWQNELSVEHQQTQTPAVEGFLKTIDLFQFQTLYLYRALPWLGPFVRARVQAPILDGFVRRAEDGELLYLDRQDPDSLVPFEANEKIELTGPFEPLIITESAGVFAEPIRKKKFTLKTKLGLGGQHVIARDGYAVSDDEDTEVIELVELQSSNALGGELELEILGQLADNVSWGFLTNFFYPFIDSYDGDLEGVDLFHIGFSGVVAVKLVDWLSLDYGLNARRLPFVIDDWQISNQLLLKASYSVF